MNVTYMEGLILMLIVVALYLVASCDLKEIFCSKFIKDHENDPVDGGEFGNKKPIAVKRKTKKKTDKVVKAKPRKKAVKKKPKK